MFDQVVEQEGLGRAEQEDARRGSPDGLGQAPPAFDQAAAGMGGIGAYVEGAGEPQYQQAAAGGMGAYIEQGPPVQQYSQPMAGEFDFIEPSDTSSGAAVRSAGFTLLFVALTTGLGYAWKGGHGAVAGLLTSAGLANGYRAQKWWSSDDSSEKHEAIVSAVFAAGEVFSGMFVGYHAVKRAEKRRE